MAHLILASSSPRRRDLLEQIGVQFTVQSADIDETIREGESPETYVLRLANAKAHEIASDDALLPCLGSDTCVVLNGRILGKPKNINDAKAMLRALSGQEHQVMTAVAIHEGERQADIVVTTHVRFLPLSDSEIQRYCDTLEPMDKAGAYGIQGKGAVLIERITGSYSNVVGLPLSETATLLKQFGIPYWQ